jgi:glycerol uptake facilitator-like aquaporin
MLVRLQAALRCGTGPRTSWCPPDRAAIRSYGWNVITEVIGTFVLVFVVISFGQQC